MTRAVLQLEGVRKAFGGLQVAQDIDLTVHEGELHALIGPNGAGKTTLLAQIAGELAPDGGRILLDGRDVTRLPVAARARAGLARSFQITALLDDMTVYENMLLAVMGRRVGPWRFRGRVHGEAPFAQQALAALRRAGLAARAQDMAAALSHGERRQLELALALAGSPRLLLLDEPMAGLSAVESRVMIRRLAALKGEHAMLLVEHDMEAVFALADRVSVLVGGRLVASGTPAEVRADPLVQAAYLAEDDEGPGERRQRS